MRPPMAFGPSGRYTDMEACKAGGDLKGPALMQ